MKGDINIFFLLGMLVPVFILGVAIGRALEIRDMRRFYESLRLPKSGQDRANHNRDP